MFSGEDFDPDPPEQQQNLNDDEGDKKPSGDDTDDEGDKKPSGDDNPSTARTLTLDDAMGFVSPASNIGMLGRVSPISEVINNVELIGEIFKQKRLQKKNMDNQIENMENILGVDFYYDPEIDDIRYLSDMGERERLNTFRELPRLFGMLPDEVSNLQRINTANQLRQRNRQMKDLEQKLEEFQRKFE